MSTYFHSLLNTIRKTAFSQHEKGTKFEKIMKAYLQTDPNYKDTFKKVWLWNEFPANKDFGGKDTGIDLVALTIDGDYWAIQCKCYQENALIDKNSVDSFLSTSSRTFADVETYKRTSFSHRLWISTTNNWGTNAQEAIKNQNPPVSRINLYDLEQAPVDWEKLENGLFGEQARIKRKSPRQHQLDAINSTHEYFQNPIANRGKLIMACGTGKTFTSLKIAENETKEKGLILFLVPSIALLGQTLREWTAEASQSINAICICSDSGVSQKKYEDSEVMSIVDLALPASTDVKNIIKQFDHIKAHSNKKGMTVVFSTYQSIDVIAKTQEELLKKDKQFGTFDLIVCDEAHRTTGVTIAGKDESAFVKVHDNDFIKAKKRIYMTATPRLYNDTVKQKAMKFDAELCSMDDILLYGEEIYRIGFGEAVKRGLLADYKVLILTVSDIDMPEAIQKMIADPNQEINTNEAAKLIGCINALSKQMLGDAASVKDADPLPMRKAVAFCSNIRDSKIITNIFNDTKKIYAESLTEEKKQGLVSVASNHVDGTMSVQQRNSYLSWLQKEPENPKECRILTNARCLSEGVDVPSLDAVLFLSARNSQVDVVQSVGRVMRIAPGKKYGYIIIPILSTTSSEAHTVLDNNDDYKIVWSVLNALRAHDDRFNATINQIELNKKRNSKINIGRPGSGNFGGEEGNTGSGHPTSEDFENQLEINFNEMQAAIYARMVDKVGDRRYWEQWAKDVAKIAERYIIRINRLISEDQEHKDAFELFLNGLQKNINPSITHEEAVEMLSQHIITKPVFEALFEGYSFVKNNPISVSMQTMLDLLEDQSLDKDADTLQKFYDSVKERASGIDNSEGKQKIIVELYDKFFKTAFPKMVEQLGIVYTPVEVVDFMIKSVDDILKKEFNRSISDENIHILDPFTGTGTFMTRILQSGLIKPEDLHRKYTKELHANEIVLLAYYIAAINIENTFHDLLISEKEEKIEFLPFDGICLTDTFQLGESDLSEKMFSEMFPQNSNRVLAQKKAPLRVIIGNPPYSAGQKSANDNAQNQEYEMLNRRIETTYAKQSNAVNNNSMYDSYIKAFRWSSDRICKENGGMIAFVSNGAWLDGNGADGFRKCLEKDFTAIYIFNLRGNQRTSGELSRKEGGKIFGSGSRTPISITFLVKNPAVIVDKAVIHYHDIGDYLNREDKLKIIEKFSTVVNPKMEWKQIESNEYGDWISQRNDAFGEYISLEPDKKYNKLSKSFFTINSLGLTTGRDAWCVNYNRGNLKTNIKNMISFYNSQVNDFIIAVRSNPNLIIDDFINFDSKKISWSRGLKRDASSYKFYEFYNNKISYFSYRPFCKQVVYFTKDLNEYLYQWTKFLPNNNVENIFICVSSSGSTTGLSLLISKFLPDSHLNGDTQCFPLYYYEKIETLQTNLFQSSEEQYVRRDGISDFILKQARGAYSNVVTKEDIFYYVYGFLHSPEYRIAYAADLKKMLPRIPLVSESIDFWAFSKAGRKLAKLHIDYEQVKPADNVVVTGAESGNFKVEKMRFLSKEDKSVINYNSKITISSIPLEAYQYTVNGKSAIEWIIERYQVTTHKDSGIKNDPNDWAEEVGNSRYILDLLLSIIRVSTETIAIVNKLPKINFE